MPQTVWKGSISFGLVSIPIRLSSATEEKDVSFRQVRASDGSRVRYRRVAEADGEEVAYADIAKGYELPGGAMVVLTDEDLAELPVPSSHAVDVVGFVPFDQIDPTALSRAYYAEPTSDAKPYVLLRDALEESGRVGIVKIALRNRERLAVLRAREGILVIQTMLWPDEVRTAGFGFLDEDIEVRQQEMAMAESYIETLAGDFHPEAYTDDYREALLEKVNAKAEGVEVEAAPEQEEADDGTVVDLMEALRRSVEDAKKNRTDDGSSSGSGSDSSAGKKSTAKKSAKKSAATKSTSKKSASKKSASKKKSEPKKSA